MTLSEFQTIYDQNPELQEETLNIVWEYWVMELDEMIDCFKEFRD